jgi:hypothetical protein
MSTKRISEKLTGFFVRFATARRQYRRRVRTGIKSLLKPSVSLTEGVMLFVAGALAVLSGLFYAAAHHEIGSLGVTMCQYGGTFCDNPSWVFVGAILAALWGTFVSIR